MERESVLQVKTTLIPQLTTSSSHVARTGDIKHFVVTEELGIAKGIRRVTALTGTKARDAQDLAKEAAEDLQHIKSLKGKEKEKAAKSYLSVGFVFQWQISHKRH